MNIDHIDRRDFLKTAGCAAAALGLMGQRVFAMDAPSPAQTAIPRWRGFNLLDYFSPNPPRRNNSSRTTEDDFRWMADWGFDFVRLPMAYPRWLSFDRSKPITPGDMTTYDDMVLEEIDQLVGLAHKYGK